MSIKEIKKAEGAADEAAQTGAEAVEGENDGAQDGAEGAGDQAGAEGDQGEGDGAGEGADAKQDIDKDAELDYDKEIDDEKKRGKPDPEAAHARIKGKREAAGEEDGEEDEGRPLTTKDLAVVEARIERKVLSGHALAIAKGLAGKHANSEKEAQLIVARWGNRTFPSGTSLVDQLEEVYAGMHRKKLIGERNEAVRALAGKSTAGKNGVGSHRQPSAVLEPKMKPQDAEAIKAAGFAWNGVTKRFEKKLPNGGLVVKDSKTGATQLISKK